jgi:hypothetical protein
VRRWFDAGFELARRATEGIGRVTPSLRLRAVISWRAFPSITMTGTTVTSYGSS